MNLAAEPCAWSSAAVWSTDATTVSGPGAADPRRLLGPEPIRRRVHRYELLAPESSSFKIIYDVTAVTPGAAFYFNPIRKGSVASDESVIDLASGQPLKFEQVSGADARKAGLANADLEGEYIKVTLARPVPAGRRGTDSHHQDLSGSEELLPPG